ncbi:MAG: hypothetical protein AAGH15_26130, partial [Myxococcota bacterium]
MDDSVLGFEVLAGGTDGFRVTRPARTATATSTLVRETLARRAAFYAVLRDLGGSDGPGLFRHVDLATDDEATIRAELVNLHRRLYGVRHDPGDPPIDDAYALFAGLRDASDDAARAWVLTLAALLEDLRFATY